MLCYREDFNNIQVAEVIVFSDFLNEIGVIKQSGNL
jgi:hypothetical protein